MLHDKSTPPLPREAHRDRIRTVPHPLVRYSLPPRHHGRLVSPIAYLPPSPSHIKPPPPPPRILSHHSQRRLTVPQKHPNMRFLPQSVTTLATVNAVYDAYNMKTKRPSMEHCVINNVHNNYFAPYNYYTNYECQQNTNACHDGSHKPSTNSKQKRDTQSEGKPKDKSDITFFVALSGITTYSVPFYTNMCGLELYPNNTENTTGAKVIKCHNLYTKSKVIVHSLLVGINNTIVLNMDYNEILKMIRFASRPLKLTFHPPPKHKTKKDKKRVTNAYQLTL
eukprot:230524_1